MDHLQIHPIAKVTAWILYGVSADTPFCQSTVTEHESVSADTPFCQSTVTEDERVSADTPFCQSTVTEHERVSADTPFCHKIRYIKILSNCETQGQLFKAVEKLLHQKGKGKLPSHSGQSEIAERFAQFFDTKIRDIHKSFPSDVDDTSKVHSGSLELP